MQHDLLHHCPTSVLLVNERNYVSKREHHSWLVSGKGGKTRGAGGGGHSGIEWLPTAKQPRGAEVVNAKI